MHTRHADKLWIAGGTLAAALLIVLTWLLLIMPKNSDTADVEADAATAETLLDTQRAQLVQLQKDSAKYDDYVVRLKTARAALPTDSGLSDLLRELRDAAADAKIEVSTLTTGSPTQVEGLSPLVYRMPLSMTVDGRTPRIQDFLDDLQRNRPRAVLIDSVSVGSAKANLATGDATATLSLHVFVSEDGDPAEDPKEQGATG